MSMLSNFGGSSISYLKLTILLIIAYAIINSTTIETIKYIILNHLIIYLVSWIILPALDILFK